MINAIVVDDERLVRKGFISLIDWASFGILIVGEAGDGKSALELLATQEVNLIFTDITMPGLSGFDLIRQVKFRYPHVHSVVLTCHHEFDYVQEALRLGAIDYMVKTLLEIDNMDDVMNRIVERIHYEDSSRVQSDSLQGSMETLPSQMLALVPLKGKQLPEPELLRLSLFQRHPLIELDHGLRIVPLSPSITLSEIQRELGDTLVGHWLSCLVTGTRDKPASEMKALLVARLTQHLFYHLPSESEMMILSVRELESVLESDQKELNQRFAMWSELKWTLYEVAWNEFVEQVVWLHPDTQQIQNFALSLLQSWSDLLRSPQEAELLATWAKQISVWSEWRLWFGRFTDLVQRHMIRLSLSKDVMFSLIRATRYMQAHAGEKINQADVASYISMSRGYFSQCFARFAGVSFGEYMRELRIELAKSLLLSSGSPVYEIAFSAGFEDEKYFSRIFREYTGLLPTEFRALGRK